MTTGSCLTFQHVLQSSAACGAEFRILQFRNQIVVDPPLCCHPRGTLPLSPAERILKASRTNAPNRTLPVCGSCLAFSGARISSSIVLASAFVISDFCPSVLVRQCSPSRHNRSHTQTPPCLRSWRLPHTTPVSSHCPSFVFSEPSCKRHSPKTSLRRPRGIAGSGDTPFTLPLMRLRAWAFEQRTRTATSATVRISGDVAAASLTVGSFSTVFKR